MKKNKLFFFLFCFLLTSCYKGHLYVQQQWVDRGSLASTYVGTPDPRQKNPLVGQCIIVSWDFPPSIYEQKLQLKLTTLLWDHKQKIFFHDIDERRGYVSFFLSNPQKLQKEKLLTYRIDVLTEKEEIIETWKHQFWTEMIDIDQNASKG